MKIKEYKVFYSVEIQQAIIDGWQPYGSGYLWHNHDDEEYDAQPMVKYDLDASTPERRKALVRVSKARTSPEILKGWVIGFSYETDLEPQGLCQGASAIFEDLNGKPSTHWLMDIQYYEWEADEKV